MGNDSCNQVVVVDRGCGLSDHRCRCRNDHRCRCRNDDGADVGDQIGVDVGAGGLGFAPDGHESILDVTLFGVAHGSRGVGHGDEGPVGINVAVFACNQNDQSFYEVNWLFYVVNWLFYVVKCYLYEVNCSFLGSKLCIF